MKHLLLFVFALSPFRFFSLFKFIQYMEKVFICLTKVNIKFYSLISIEAHAYFGFFHACFSCVIWPFKYLAIKAI